MLAGSWPRDMHKVVCLMFLFVAVVAPRPAAADALTAVSDSGLDARTLLLIGVFAGSIVFAVVAGGLLLRAARRANTAEKQARSAAGELEAEKASLQALIAAEPQILIHWNAGGTPVLAAATLDPSLKIPRDVEDVVRFESWLDARSARELTERVSTLLEAGESFAEIVVTASGAGIEAMGRAAGTGAIVKLRDMSGDRQRMADLAGASGEKCNDADAARALYDSLPMPVWFRDGDGRLSWVNRAYASAVDAEHGGAVCEQQLEFLSSRQRALADRDLKEGEAHTNRVHAIVSGERRAFDVIAKPIGQASAGIAIDVAALESAESALSQRFEEHKRTLERIATAVAIFSPDQRLQYCNQAFVDLWGLEEAWLANRPTNGEILDALRRQRCLPEEADYRAWKQKQLGGEETAASQENSWHLPDGRTIHVVANHAADGSATFLYDNITEQLALKSRYNALIHVQKETLDHLREGVAVFGTDGRLKLFNPAFASIWRLNVEALGDEPHIDEVIDWCRVLLDEDAAWDEVKRAITGIDDERGSLQGTLTRPDGSILAYAGLPLPDGATLLTYLDITDTKRVENALIERNEALVAADRLKSAFISHVSYELRTPLTNIIGFAQLLASQRTGDLNERQQEYLGDIQTSSDALLAIVNDILDLATIDAGALELSLTRVAADEVIGAAVAGVQERIKQGGLDLQVRVSEDAREFVADSRRVTQALFNLLSNAVGFSEAGGRIVIDCRRENEMIAICVEDEGRGIPEDYQESAFDRFETRPLGSRHRGAGLGLTIVKNLVELHGGHVALNSAPGVGTTVTLSLPLKQQQGREPQQRNEAELDDQGAGTPPAAAAG
ncbi:MAG: PAS-domain containing protein [Hyphomicrobiaceae bacterium]|nr:PAS-domain containing protein [Hyphomicrobiaceae bacterium]